MVILSDYDDSATTSNAATLYDVFLSFRGLDTRHGFTGHLYKHLIRADIPTFRDEEELERGEPLKQQLEEAIQQSSVSIIVFSQNYASSKWCLDEVVRILEQKKIRGNHYKVLPVFYKVDPSEVRYQRGSYEKAFNEHKKKRRVSSEKIEGWKAALTEAANLVGLPLNNNESETKFIDEILSCVKKNLPNRKALEDVPEHLVGMDYRDNWIDSWLRNESKDDNDSVLIILGNGGIGKSTMAKRLFNEYYRQFDGSCFLAGVAARWDQNEICGLQSQLLSSILNMPRKETKIYSCNEGTQEIKRALWNKKFLLVLDDVTETEQLEALLGQRQQFYPGSKVLATTRNEFLSKYFTFDPKIYRVPCLNHRDSLKLFSWRAFRQCHPPEEFKQLSEEILKRCDGLPLALTVLGSSLLKSCKSKDIVFWEQQLQKWDEIVNPGINKVMKISYDTLEDDTVKSLFLHIACFFVGEEIDYIVKILERRGMHAAVGIQSLIERSLITINAKKLMMHRVIQDMGREIVRQESPEEPGQRSRLWSHEDSLTVLRYDRGSEAVRGLILDGQKLKKVESDGSSFSPIDANPSSLTKLLGYVEKKKEEVLDKFLPSKEGDLKIDAFAKMINLELVKLNHVDLTGSYKKFSEQLRWICWHGFSQEYVPMELHVQNLIAFDLEHSRLKQVWKGYKEVQSLKFLNLSYSLDLYQTPDFCGLVQLEILLLRGCSKLVIVCKSIGILQKLVLLDLRDCKSLRDLPDLPKSIQTVELSGCDLGKFPREQQEVEPFVWKRIVKFASPSIATGPVRLLAGLPHLIVRLNLEGCNLSDECFPRDFGGLSSLKKMNLTGNMITRLPYCVSNLSKARLSELIICDCPQLRSVINLPIAVTHTRILRNRQLAKYKTGLNPSDGMLLDIQVHTEHIEIEGCIKVVEALNVHREVIKNLGLESLLIDLSRVKVVYEFGIFSSCVVGISKVPSGFTTPPMASTEEVIKYRWDRIVSLCRSPSIPYTISYSAKKIQGLNICFAIRIKRLTAYPGHLFKFYVTIRNKTKDYAWTYECRDNILGVLFRKNEIQEVPMGEGYLWVSTWKCMDVMEAGDKLEVFYSFRNIGAYNFHEFHEVKEFGIRMVYEEDTDLRDSTSTDVDLLWTDEMNVSCSNYCTRRTSYFFQSTSAWPDLQVLFSFEEQRSGSSFKWVNLNGEKRNGHTARFVDWFDNPPGASKSSVILNYDKM